MSGELKTSVYSLLFKTDSRSGRLFDIFLLCAIALSTLTVMLDSVASISSVFGGLLKNAEWLFTVLFTLEYILRLYSAKKTTSYALSFFGIIDLLAILPTYLSLLTGGAHSLIIMRVFRLLRIFRILRLRHFIGEAYSLQATLRRALPKITVFITAVISIVFVIGTVMYMVEGEQSGFSSIPVSVYWAVVTMTTVGYGDIAPRTAAGQMLASVLMIIGYGIIAIPTGILSAEFVRNREASPNDHSCSECGLKINEPDARFCKNCGKQITLNPDK